MKEPSEKSAREKGAWVSWGTGLLMLLLAAETWKAVDGRWGYIGHMPVYIYAGVLTLYLGAERIAYRGSGSKGKQTKIWTRHLLLLFWLPLLIVPVLEYSLYPRYDFTVTVIGAALTLLGTGLRAWGLWTLGKYFSAHIEIKADHELVETGPYKFIRHPAYAGNILQAVGIPLILNAYFSMSISAVLIALFLYRLKLEEEVLAREVKGYGAYMIGLTGSYRRYGKLES
ncbi:hypothetical protein FTO70_10390 [Methanosarcina sp. KYL-1]|uniref:methyltransferase family protein n=1 Tax=Methanosarcina sp. KYL-1 TaxID=2602068 RepID=UPI0021012987|nr:protein-S-isoprenylcysteine O-methyltransferase [Methanosarcina sp. KYL-1]MCQ1536080.1 hypothetical protein [Methanosarcina sp. KYL-1]